jgi:molybdopterin-synthase adenylyltransferase
MTDEQLLRYSRHILLSDIGIEGQERILASHALIIGAGGLGSPAALYLGSAGVGQITIVDNDVVDMTNLQRQIAHHQARVGMNKAHSASEAIAAVNPEIKINCVTQRADARLLDIWVAQADVVLDCSDNFATRHALNTACIKHRKPLVSGAAVGFDGQISVFDMRQGHATRTTSPCYACVFPPNAAYEERRCATMGVFAPLVGMIGSMQAAEALKIIIGAGSPLVGRLQMLDGRQMAWTEIQIAQQPNCPACSQMHQPEPLHGKSGLKP